MKRDLTYRKSKDDQNSQFYSRKMCKILLCSTNKKFLLIYKQVEILPKTKISSYAPFINKTSKNPLTIYFTHAFCTITSPKMNDITIALV